MALVGDFLQYESVEVEGETETITVNYPSDLPIGHPMYDKRGSTETESHPKVIQKEVITKDAYLYIKSVNVWQPNQDFLNKFLVNITYEVFNSKSDREIDPNSYFYSGSAIGRTVEFSSGNIIQECYDIIKSEANCSLMKKD